MCGIAGMVGRHPEMEQMVARMAACLEHRGPDASGLWSEPALGVALGHRRLAILDLSPAGAQPMVSGSGRWVLVVNGEIYNFAELRSEIPGSWRGHSDTEVLVEALDSWGALTTLKKISGMFALAAYDRQDRTLWLARDRMGEKPLYYSWTPCGFAFASEIKSLTLLFQDRPQVDRAALELLLRFSYIPSPYSIYENICKLEPGCYLRLPDLHQNRPTPQRYWDLSEIAQRPATATGESELQAALHRSVSNQLVADVPVGALLSGGIDSSLIVAIMQQHSAQPIKTFTVGFAEHEFDESGYARQVARHLGTDHHELLVTAQDALSVIPNLSQIYSEPLGDVSQIPTYLVCQLARKQVTVALSGDGGDELFGGYTHYPRGAWLWRHWRHLPEVYQTLILQGYRILVQPALQRAPGKLARRLQEVLWNSLSLLEAGQTFEGFYERLVSRVAEVHTLLASPSMHPSLLSAPTPYNLLEPNQLALMLRDSLTYLPDDVLCKVDRAAMSVSLETRVPFLDHKVVEAAWSLPPDLRFSRKQGKIVLRKMLKNYLPDSLINRPKAGFSVPIGQWLRGPLKSWASDLLSPQSLKSQGFLRAGAVEQLWREHCQGVRHHDSALWNILSFQSWLLDSKAW